MRRFGGSDGESVRITPFGILLIALVVVGVLLAGVGPRSAQAPGLAMAALGGMVLFGGSAMSMGRGRWGTKDLAERRDDFGPRARKHSDVPLSKEAEDALWQAERERRRRDGHSA